MSHWLDDAARGLAGGTHSRRDVLHRGMVAAGAGLFAALATPAAALAADSKRCPDGHHCGGGTICCKADCCDPSTEVCCAGRGCCDKADCIACSTTSICRTRTLSCCHGEGTYNPSISKCCPGKGFHVCAKDEYCCGTDACCKDASDCVNGKCKEPALCKNLGGCKSSAAPQCCANGTKYEACIEKDAKCCPNDDLCVGAKGELAYCAPTGSYQYAPAAGNGYTGQACCRGGVGGFVCTDGTCCHTDCLPGGTCSS